MKRKIQVNEKVLAVNNIYPYRHDYGKGKEVLRIEVSEEFHTFEEIKTTLKDCKYPIQYLEDDTLKNEYKNYSIDFNCQYNNGIYNVEITRLSQQEQDIQILNDAIVEIASLLGGK